MSFIVFSLEYLYPKFLLLRPVAPGGFRGFTALQEKLIRNFNPLSASCEWEKWCYLPANSSCSNIKRNQSNKLWKHLSLAQCLKIYNSWSDVNLHDAPSFSLDLKRLKLRDEAWIMCRGLSVTLEILFLLLLEILLLVLILLFPAIRVSPSLFAVLCTTLIRLSTAFLMSLLRRVFATICRQFWFERMSTFERDLYWICHLVCTSH